MKPSLLHLQTMQPLAYLNGQFVPASQAMVPLNDAGFMMGVTIAERLRTFGGKLFRLQSHLSRLARSLEIVQIRPGETIEALGAAAEELVAHQYKMLAAGDDLGLTLFVTPGTYGLPNAQPRVCMHTSPLPFADWAELYQQGQPLRTTPVMQTPAECWPLELKCRSRMHYYLADQFAAGEQPGSRAVMLDEEGNVTEASTANIVIYRRQEGLISPPREAILPGVSVAMLEQIATELDTPFLHQPLTPADVAAADEVFLCSTSPCILPATQFNGMPIGDGQPGAMLDRCLKQWGEHVGVDLRRQASQFAVRG